MILICFHRVTIAESHFSIRIFNALSDMTQWTIPYWDTTITIINKIRSFKPLNTTVSIRIKILKKCNWFNFVYHSEIYWLHKVQPWANYVCKSNTHLNTHVYVGTIYDISCVLNTSILHLNLIKAIFVRKFVKKWSLKNLLKKVTLSMDY